VSLILSAFLGHEGRVGRDESRGPDPRLLQEVGDLATPRNLELLPLKTHKVNSQGRASRQATGGSASSRGKGCILT
jgi:hypothetical protein